MSDDIVERLRSWAQNEEMIDSSYLAHGLDCNTAADLIERQRKELETARELLADAVELLEEVEFDNDPPLSFVRRLEAARAFFSPTERNKEQGT